CAGNIDVRPGIAIDKLTQEPTGSDTPSGSTASILDIGNLRLHQVTIFIPEGEFPTALPGGFTSSDHCTDQSRVSPHHAAGEMTQPDHDCPGKSGAVDHCCGM